MNGAKMCPVVSERILLATDGSEYSKGAIREAIAFAKKCSSRLYVMSVVVEVNADGETPTQKVEEAMEAEAQKRIDLIFIGRRGTTGLKRLLMGDVASKVIGHADCKVVVVPRAAVIGPKTILVATDGSGHSIAAAGRLA